MLHPKWSRQKRVSIKQEWWPFGPKKVFLKQITSEQQLVNQARAVLKGECVVIWCRDRRLIKGDILEESTCCILNDSWRSKGERKTKKYSRRRTVEKDWNKVGRKSWEVAKVVAQDRKCWWSSMKTFCACWRNETWWWWKVLTLDQINQQSNEETCENERTEQVEEPLLWWPVSSLAGKNEKWGLGGGGGVQEKLIILYNLLQMIQDELAEKDVERPVNLRNVERSLLKRVVDDVMRLNWYF